MDGCMVPLHGYPLEEATVFFPVDGRFCREMFIRNLDFLNDV
jgi:hypothetical protein